MLIAFERNISCKFTRDYILSPQRTTVNNSNQIEAGGFSSTGTGLPSLFQPSVSLFLVSGGVWGLVVGSVFLIWFRWWSYGGVSSVRGRRPLLPLPLLLPRSLSEINSPITGSSSSLTGGTAVLFQARRWWSRLFPVWWLCRLSAVTSMVVLGGVLLGLSARWIWLTFFSGRLSSSLLTMDLWWLGISLLQWQSMASSRVIVFLYWGFGLRFGWRWSSHPSPATLRCGETIVRRRSSDCWSCKGRDLDLSNTGSGC